MGRKECSLESRVVFSVPVVSVRGDLDDPRSFDLGQVLHKRATEGYRALIADFTEVDRIGVVGLSAVLDMCGAAGRTAVSIKAVVPSHIELLVATKLATCFGFEIYESLQAALNAEVERQREATRLVACA